MILSRHSFELLSRAEIKKIRLASRLKNKNLAALELKKDSPKKAEALVFGSIPASNVVGAEMRKIRPVLELKKDSQKLEKLEKLEKSETDNRKRTFLKLAGLVGLGVAASSLFPKKAEALVFGSTPASNVVGIKDSTNARISPATEGTLSSIKTGTDNLSGIKTSTDPLVAAGAGGYIRQDSTATIAKESGGNLATIAGKDFATQTTLAGIKTQSDKLQFDASNYLKTVGATGSDVVGLKDISSTQVNPATDESILYLRRMVKLMESQATVDAGNRQRITIDSLGTGTAVTTTIPVSGTVTTTLGAGTAVIGSILLLAGQNQQMFQDVARNAYANGIRNNLTFS